MRVSIIERGNGHNKISKITYEDGTYYYGFEINGIRVSYGKLCNSNGKIIKAGVWLNDECIELMTKEQIEKELEDKY